MTNRVILYPYKTESESAKDLARNLAISGMRTLRVRPNGSYRPREGDLILNWGNSRLPETWAGTIHNAPQLVETATNKLSFFNLLEGTRITTPEYTSNPVEATNWVIEGNTVLARTVLNGHSGEGIVIIRNTSEMVSSRLYVKYKKKRNEFRVHVFDGEVIDTQEKRRDRDVDRTADQSLIRSHANGWVFCRDNINITSRQMERLHQLAIDTIDILDLTFGAVDIIYNEREDTFYVLEVNTAPGLEGQTLVNYTRAVLKLASE